LLEFCCKVTISAPAIEQQFYTDRIRDLTAELQQESARRDRSAGPRAREVSLHRSHHARLESLMLPSHCADWRSQCAPLVSAEIVESRHPDYKKGDCVTGFTGLQDYVIVDESAKRFLPKSLEDSLRFGHRLPSVLGINGLTAFFGMEIAAPKKGDTLVVSADAGATGIIVGQSGRFTVAASLASPVATTKCAWITKELGFDAAINYKHPGLEGKTNRGHTQRHRHRF